MEIFVPKEVYRSENRVPLIPSSVQKLVKLGANVVIESGMGDGSHYTDAEYTAVGAKVSKDRKKSFASADMVLRLRKPDVAEIKFLKKGAIHVSYLDPFNEAKLLDAMAKQQVTAISMEMIPRISRAQKMDSLSSQASLAGYVAVTVAAERIEKVFPMMMTPAGTITPAKVFIIGAGVAGLQAIATAKRLGARVEAFDTRPVVKDQVQSLGAKFVEVDLGQTGQTAGGYAKELTKEQLEKQRQVMAERCVASDVVITTAQLFGKKAPVLVTKDMIAKMKPGSIVVDLAVETGGNVEGSVMDKEVDKNGVRIIGIANLPGKVAVHASQMYSSNMFSLVEEFWDKEAKSFTLKLDDEILKGCVMTHGGKIIHPTFAKTGEKK